MVRRRLSASERQQYALEASRSGDAVVARKLGLSRETVAGWRRTHGLAAQGRAQGRPPDTPSPFKAASPVATDEPQRTEGAFNVPSVPAPESHPAVSSMSLAERRALADRTVFRLGADAQRAWEEMDHRPARDLPELRELMDWRSPLVEGDAPVPDAAAT